MNKLKPLKHLSNTMKKIIKVIFLLITISSLYSQPDNFTSNYNNYNCFAFDDDNYYVGLVNGFVVQDRATGDYEYYSTLNSDMKGNNVSDIEVYKGKVYLLTEGKVYAYKNSLVKKFEMQDLYITGMFKDKNNNLWFNGSEVLLKYNGNNIFNIDISYPISLAGKIAKIDVIEDYLWLTFGKGTINHRESIYYILQDSLKTFSIEDRGFDREYRNFQTVSNKKIWIKTQPGRIYKYDILTDQWDKVDKFKFPINTRISSNIVQDDLGKLWFAITETERDYKVYLASYDGFSDDIEVHYDYEFNRDLEPLIFYSFKDRILFTNENSYFLIENNNINRITEFDENYRYSNVSNFYNAGEDVLFIARIKDNDVSKVEFLNLVSDESEKYEVNETDNLPYSNIGSYYKLDGMEFISRHYHKITRVKKDGVWQSTSVIGIEEDKGIKLEIDKNGDYYLFNNSVFKYENGYTEKLFNYSSEWLKGIEVFDKNFYFYRSYEVKDYNSNTNLFRNFGVKVSILDEVGNINKVINDSNSCISKWYEYGKVSYSVHGPIPLDLRVDNQEFIWYLTAESLYYMDENLNCTNFDFDEENEEGEEVDNPLPNQIAYSRYQGNMYGRHDNIVYSFGNTNYRKTNSEDMVDGELNFIGECNDGLVYVATTDGRLFRLNTIDSWEKIPLIEGKEKIHANIHNVFRSEDTLYVSTEIGLIKVHQKITSVAEGSTELAEINVFPNPVDDKLALTGYEGRALIYNSFGTEVKAISTSKSDINVSDLAPGIYFITDVYGMLIAKFVKE